MADSVYPGALDSDIQIQRVDDNITEIGGEAINGLRSAVFNIEETLGLDPQGTTADLATRLSVSMNPDGSLKASALASIGLVTLPITNSQIAPNAGIEESKLDLDFSTVTLRTLIANLEAFAEAINQNLLQDIGNLNQHVAHPGVYGRHQLRDVDGYIGKYAAYNLQGIITEIDDTLVDHIASSKVGAHSGENVSVDDTFLNINADNVQTAVEELDELQDTLLIQHRDDFHSNGILRAQETYLDGYNNAGITIASDTLNSIVGGDNSVQYAVAPSELASVSRGDIIEVSSGTQAFRFHINQVNSSTGTVSFFGKVPLSIASPTAIIYARTDETSAVSNLVLTRRQSNSIQVVHPGAAFVLSHRADPRKITSVVKLLRFRWHDGESGDIDVKDVLETYVFGKPSTWTVENLVTALNEYFHSYSTSPFKRPLPLIAFSYNGEFGVAYDEANDEAYVEVVTPNVSANSASAALGLIEGTLNFGLGPRRVSIDGYQVSSIRQKVDTTGQATGNSIDTFPVGVDVLSAGLETGDLVRVYGGANANNEGGFIANSVSAAAVTFTPSPGFITETVNFKAWNDTFTLAASPGVPTLYELFADDYNGQEIRLQGATRLTYQQASASSENLEQVFDIVDVSRNFGNSSRRIYFDLSENTLTLGQVGSSDELLADTEGESVTLPSTVNAAGFRFKLYDNNNTDYLEIQVANPNYLSFLDDAALDVEVYDRVREDKFLQLGVTLHNTTEFRHLSDRRLFGNVGRADVRDDFTRDYISYPASVLRSKGVVYGMEVASRNDGNIDAYGGEIFVDGSVSVIPTRDIAIPQDSEATTFNLFVEGGRLHLLRDDQVVGTNGAIISSPSLTEIMESNDKLLIAQIDVNASNQIQEIRDYRRFVNNLDDKMELIVEENTITNGAFPTMRGALNWISAMDAAGLPVSRVIKVRGVIDVDLSDGALAVPEGVTIDGDSQSTDESTLRSTINFVGTNTDDGAFQVEDGVTIKNLLFTSDASSTVNTSLFFNDTVTNLTLKACHFNDVLGSLALTVVQSTTGSIDKCLIEDCHLLSEDSGVNQVGFVYGTTSANNISIKNSTFEPKQPGGTPFLVAADYVDGARISHCKLDYVSTSSWNWVIYGATYAYDVQVSNCELNLGQSTGTTGSVVSSGNTIERVLISGNIVKHSTANTNNYVVHSPSVLNNCDVSNNYFYRTSTVASALTGTNIQVTNNTTEDSVGTFINILTLTDGNLSNNVVNFDSPAATNFFFNATTLDNVILANNYTQDASRFARATTADKLNIVGNILEDLDEELLLVTNAVSLLIKGNSVSKSGVTSHCVEISTLATQTLIDGNILICTSGSTAGNDMISIIGCEDATISNNVFQNSGTTGLVAAVSASGEGILISNNVIRDFTQGGGYSILIDSATNTVIDGNVLTDVSGGVRINDCTDLKFCGNLVESSTGYRAIDIDSTTGTSRVNISGNVLRGSATISTGDLINIEGSLTGDILINNNICSQAHTNTFSGRMILTNGVAYVTVSNNVFINTTGDYVSEPLGLAGYRTSAIYNDLRQVSRSGSNDLVVAGRDYMNWGQEYTIYIPISHAMLGSDATNNGTIPWNGWTDTYVRIYDTDLSAGIALGARIMHPITGFVPAGATITEVTMGYERSGADVSKCIAAFYLKKLQTTFGISSDLWGSANATDTSGSTVTATISLSQVIDYDDAVQLETWVYESSSGTGWEFVYRGMTVTYTL